MTPRDDPSHIAAGSLPTSWPPAGPDCTAVPDFHVHAYNDDFWILRQSGCTHFEKPFLFLIFGMEKALLLDTGAGNVDVAAAVERIVTEWRARRGRTVDLIVAHTHNHDDHVAGDAQFEGRPGTTVVAPGLESTVNFFGLDGWPDQVVQLDLGGRILDVVPIPGHEESGIALYDRRTAVLLTGDTLYPGRLYVRDAAAFVESVRRLTGFTSSRPVAHVLGCHIENTRTPFVDYPAGTVNQPDEHTFELGREKLLELNEALQQMNGQVVKRVMRDFTIWPVGPEA